MSEPTAPPAPDTTSSPTTPASALSRRRFLAVAAGAGAAAVASSAVAGAIVGPAVIDAVSSATGVGIGPAPVRGGNRVIVPFDGAHQAGIVAPVLQQPATLMVAFDSVATDRAALVATLRELTRRGRDLAGAWSPPAGDPLFPPTESGITGSTTGPGRPDHDRQRRRLAVRRALRAGRPHARGS